LDGTLTQSSAIQVVKHWLQHVVIGLNFCPYANQVVMSNRLLFQQCDASESGVILDAVLEEAMYLDANPEVETTLLILSNACKDFPSYISLLGEAENLLAAHAYEGVYQIASFHPDYCFADAADDDPANYTNRSPFPIFHLLREESLSQMIDAHPDIDSIPKRNIAVARGLGLEAMKNLLQLSQES